MQNNQIEQAKKFTEDNYLTKEEIQSKFNSENVDEIWKNILFFRSFYDCETELRDSSLLPYKICLTKHLSNKAYEFQIKLMNDLMRFTLLSDDLKKSYDIEKEAYTLEILSKRNNISIALTSINKIISETIENIPSSFFPLKAYHDAYKYIKTIDSINIQEIERINAIVSGDSSESPKIHYREKEDIDSVNFIEHVPVSDINTHLNQLLSFLNQEDIPPILKALTIPYFFAYVLPFEFCNEETACLLAKCYLSKTGFSNIGLSLDFESIAFTSSKSFFERLKIVQKTLDLTYCLNRFLDFEIQQEETIKKTLEQLSIKKILQNSSSINEEKETNHPDESYSLLINFPIEESSEKIQAKTLKLLEMHPQLKKKQAHFYAGHCTLGLNYTIEQFKNEENTVYETARTSMEDLAKKGFYKKILIGKKFVYTPIQIQSNESLEFSDDITQ